MKKSVSILFIVFFTITASGQETIRVLPKEIDDVLINPGIGFTTFQRFNGDTLNRGLRWTEGHLIEYQYFDGKLENEDHPMTSIAYFRIYWRYLEPKDGGYNWDLLDHALYTARKRNQTLMLRVAPYGSGPPETDVPSWYRTVVGEKNEWEPIGRKWMVNPEDSKYAHYFGRMISELGKKYDGHPDLESVDLAIIGGAWISFMWVRPAAVAV